MWSPKGLHRAKFLSIFSDDGATSKKRRIQTCPLKECGHRKVSSACFARHLSKFHKLTKQERQRIQFIHKTRKTYTWKAERPAAKYKDYHVQRKCPVHKCGAVVKRLKPHLTGKFHNITDPELLKSLMLKWKGTVPQPKKGVPHFILSNPFPESDSGSEFHETNHESDDLVDSDTNSFSNDEDVESASSRSLIDEVKDLQTPHIMNNYTVDAILDSFYQYLISADCGNKDQRSSRQHQSQVRAILCAIDETMDIASLTNCKLIRERFLKLHCSRKKLGPRTIKSYLQSLNHIYNFFLSEFTALFENELLTQCQIKVRNWMKSFQRECSMQKHLKDDYEEETILTAEKIRKFEQSEVCREAILLLGKLAETNRAAINLSQQSFTNIRDFIMSEILINNAHRSGVLANVTYSEFLNHRMKDGLYIIKVHRHKTLGSHGPARIILNETVFQWLETYVTRVRPLINCLPAASDRLFLTWNGGVLTSGELLFILT